MRENFARNKKMREEAKKKKKEEKKNRRLQEKQAGAQAESAPEQTPTE